MFDADSEDGTPPARARPPHPAAEPTPTRRTGGRASADQGASRSSTGQVTFGKRTSYDSAARDLSPSDFAEDRFLHQMSGTEPEVEPLTSNLSSNSGAASPDSRSKFGRGRRRLRPPAVPGVLEKPPGQTFASSAFHGLVLWFATLEQQYGVRLLLLLHTAQHLLKGVVMQFQASTIMWILMEYRINGPQLQVYTSVASSAWALKPVIGMISDFVPICGYRKAPYVILTSLLGVVCTINIGFSTHETRSAMFVVACFFGMGLQAATCDLLTEAKYSEHLQDDPEHGPDLITYVWGGVSIGNMIAISVVGWLIVYLSPRAVFLTCIIPAAAILYPTMANFFEETPMSPQLIQQVKRRYMKQKEIIVLGGAMTLMTVFLSCIGAFTSSQTLHFIAALCVIAVLLPSFYITLRPEIAKVNTFFVLQGALSLNIGGATFFFYTDTDKQYPAGPHFTPGFFASTLGFVSSIMSLIGLITYTKYMKGWSYRSLIFLSNALVTLLSTMDIIMFRRLNVQWGISDEYFVMGSSVATVAIRQWQWMPGIVMMSQLCPKGMEATMFALLAGCSAVGGQVSDYTGACLLSSLGVHPSGSPDEASQFDNLWKASLVSTLLPAITILLIPVFIPDAKQTDRLLTKDTASATAGSLLSQWMASRAERSTV